MNILIADDSQSTRMLVQTTLSQPGNEITHARDGIETWDIVQGRNPPELIILDWMMPGMDGLEICRRIRARGDGPYIYILILTANDRQEEIVVGLEAGADDYLCKPFNPQELQGRVRTGRRILDLQHNLLSSLNELKQTRDELEGKQLALINLIGDLERLATQDGLTGLKNYRAFQERLTTDFNRAQRYSHPLSLVLLDIDLFKEYNDSYGHVEGDRVLKTIARILQAHCRESDFVARYGGEEFAIIMPETDTQGARVASERIREAVEAAPWPLRGVTASFGVASLSIDIRHEAEFVAKVDRALYYSKQTGRNRVSDPDQVSGDTVIRDMAARER
jgi:diguanylate cyclase (GGDEF)-like protein